MKWIRWFNDAAAAVLPKQCHPFLCLVLCFRINTTKRRLCASLFHYTHYHYCCCCCYLLQHPPPSAFKPKSYYDNDDEWVLMTIFALNLIVTTDKKLAFNSIFSSFCYYLLLISNAKTKGDKTNQNENEDGEHLTHKRYEWQRFSLQNAAAALAWHWTVVVV